MSFFPELYFNVDNGYLEGLVRGLKAGVLSQADYLNLVQCETLEDLKLHLQSTDYGNFLANEASPLTVSVIDDKLKEKMVVEFRHMRNHAYEPLASFLDFITWVRWRMPGILALRRNRTEMNICNKPSNKTAPEKSVWTAPSQDSGPSPELQGQRSRRNGWSWPPHPLQIVAWLLYLFFAVIGFGVLVPLLPHHWVPAGYACMGAIFAGHLVVHLTAVSIDPADANVRDKSYSGPLPIFNRSQHAHVIEDLHCNLCDVDVTFSRDPTSCFHQRARALLIAAVRGRAEVPVGNQEPGLTQVAMLDGLADHQAPSPQTSTGVRDPNTAAPAISAYAASITIASGSTTAWARGTIVWHKLTTYEYIVQHRPAQEAKETHKELESCPRKVRSIQEMEFYMRTFSHVRPEPSGQARTAALNAKKRGSGECIDCPGLGSWTESSHCPGYGGGMAASTDIAGLEESFRKFAIHGDPKASGQEMNGKNWAKLCKDCKVADGKAVTGTDVDIVFSKVKAKSARVINYEEFKKALEELATKRFKGKSKEEAFDAICQLIAGKEPANIGVTKAKTGGAVDRLTDTSKYTGSHKERFDESGKGKGIAGRQDILDDSGYVSAYKNAGTYDAKVKK